MLARSFAFLVLSVALACSFRRQPPPGADNLDLPLRTTLAAWLLAEGEHR